ncbi:DUF3343 domain-containing protein [Luoshenia tenuis]|uniref:DUF3343 domain-containing protein n=1 Tax=Luoshenia tenuis TaxID=2763654 RepID=UPI003D89F0C4
MTRDHYGLAAFRSRQQAIYFANQLQRAGVRASTVNTPREVSLGCGISVRFDPGQMAKAQSLLRRTNPTTLIGLYDATRDERNVALKRVSTSNF